MSTERKNYVRERLERGETVVGAQTKTNSLEVIELFGELGLDYVWIDLEHAGPSPFDGPALEAYVRAAESADTSLLVRLPSGDPHMIRKVLDTGVRTILIPRVETADEVRTAVRAARFTYEGEPGDRGVGTARGSRWGRDLGDHARREDETVLIGAMIENRTAVENLDSILDVPQLGFAFIGPADLSVSLGVPLETDAPIVRDHVERVVDAAVSSDVPVGQIANDAEAIKSALDDGCQLLRVGSDLDAIRMRFDRLLEEISE